MISLPFASVYLINPKPFTLLISLGSFFILVSIVMLVGWKVILEKSGSYVGMVVYWISLLGGLYCGIFYVGYFKTISVLLI